MALDGLDERDRPSEMCVDCDDASTREDGPGLDEEHWVGQVERAGNLTSRPVDLAARGTLRLGREVDPECSTVVLVDPYRPHKSRQKPPRASARFAPLPTDIERQASVTCARRRTSRGRLDGGRAPNPLGHDVDLGQERPG